MSKKYINILYMDGFQIQAELHGVQSLKEHAEQIKRSEKIILNTGSKAENGVLDSELILNTNQNFIRTIQVVEVSDLAIMPNLADPKDIAKNPSIKH